jgi:hypothetical protein
VCVILREEGRREIKCKTSCGIEEMKFERTNVNQKKGRTVYEEHKRSSSSGKTEHLNRGQEAPHQKYT